MDGCLLRTTRPESRQGASHPSQAVVAGSVPHPEIARPRRWSGARLFRMGRNEVSIVATSANRTDMMRLWSLPILAVFDPGLGTPLHRVPGPVVWRSAANVKLVEGVYPAAVKQ